MACVNGGVFKARRNKTHILKVKNDIERDELIQKAITKHANFDQSFDRVSPYVLLYPDFREVYFVPGTNETFSLSKYKEAISKDYQKLTFCLCLRNEFAFNQFSNSDWSSAVESEKDAGYDNQPTLTTTDKKEKDKENGHEVKPTVSAATTNNPPIVVMDDDDDPLLLLALNQSQQDEGTSMPALSSSTEKNEEDLSVQVS